MVSTTFLIYFQFFFDAKNPPTTFIIGGSSGRYHVLVGELFKGIDIHQCNQSRIREILYGKL